MTPPPSQALLPMTMARAVSHLVTAWPGFDGMGWGQQLDVRADLDVVADRDAGYVRLRGCAEAR
jgi:hypothetical protein